MVNFDTAKQPSMGIESVFERIHQDVDEHVQKIMPKEVVEWIRCNMNYNIRDSKRNHVMSVVDIVKILRGETLSGDEYFKAVLLGWCIEMLRASRLYLRSDDVPKERLGKQCWLVAEGIVIKDSFCLDAVMYYLLKKYFRMETCYIHLLELFQDTTFEMEMCQQASLIANAECSIDLDRFSLQRHGPIARRKTATVYLSFALAMCICGIPESYMIQGHVFSPYITARSILLQICEYLEIRDEFVNELCASEKFSQMKADNQHSWRIIAARMIASPEQRRVSEENYGRVDVEKEMGVKEIYEAVGLKEQFLAYEACQKERIEALIAEIPESEGDVDGLELKREVFTSFFNKLYEGAR